MGTCLSPIEIECLLADSLSPADRARAEAHLVECEKCRSELHEKPGQDHLFRDIQDAYAKKAAMQGGRNTEGQSAASISDSIDGYEVLAEIHRGGQGVVYKAVQQATKRTVALKVLLEGPYASPTQRRRFEREIDLVAGLRHPNIVTVYDSGVTSDRRHYFAMDYIDGLPLDTYLSDSSLSIDEILRLFQKICTAVSYAHQRGVIHRDLKPGNIRIDAVGEPHVLDFGLAKLAGVDPQAGAPVTVTGEFMGTLAYASPEQTKGDPQLIDIRTDVYSLGVVLYEMLTGSYPYEVVGQMADVLRNIAEVEPKRPSTIRRRINDEVETIILKTLAKDRDRRYQSAETLARDIEHYLHGEPIDAKRDSAWYVIRKTMQRYRVAAGVALSFVLLLGASTIALSIMYRNQSRARQEAEIAHKGAVRARTSEEAQRKLAEQRANELETVTGFQQSMLGGIDAEKMGRGIIEELRQGIRNGLEKEEVTPQEVESSLASFDRLVVRSNATNLALNVVDKNVLSRAVKAIQKDFTDKPLIRASLQYTVADTYMAIGLFEPAIQLEEASLQIRRRVLGDDHPDTLISMSTLAQLFRFMGRYEDALPYYAEVLETRRRTLGDSHPNTLLSITSMGLVLKSMGRFQEALPYSREAVESRRRILGPDHPATLDAVNSLGRLLESMGRYEEAMVYFREDLEGCHRILGDDHRNTLQSIMSMGRLLQRLGKYEQARPYYIEALEGYRRVLGDDHPDTIIAVLNMGALLRLDGKLKESERYYRDALRRSRRVLGDEHPTTLVVIDGVGGLLTEMDRHDEALRYLSEAIKTQRRTLGDDHPNTLNSILNMGRLMRKLGRLEEAEAFGAEAVRGANVKLAPSHPFRLIAIGDYGQSLAKLQRYAEAEGHLLEAQEGLATILGPSHRRTIKIINYIIELYDAWNAAEPDQGYDAKAAAWRAKLPQAVDEAESESR